MVQSSPSARLRIALRALETQQKEKGNQHGSTGSRRSADGIRAAPPFLVERVGGVEGGGVAGEGSYLRFNCRWRLRLFQDRKSSPKIKQTDKKNSKGAFNLERSTLPTKDCKSWVQSSGAGQAQVPRQSPGLGGPGGGQHRLMLSPLARAPGRPPNTGRSAGRDRGRSMVSDFPSPSFQGSSGRW